MAGKLWKNFGLRSGRREQTDLNEGQTGGNRGLVFEDEEEDFNVSAGHQHQGDDRLMNELMADSSSGYEEDDIEDNINETTATTTTTTNTTGQNLNTSGKFSFVKRVYKTSTPRGQQQQHQQLQQQEQHSSSDKNNIAKIINNNNSNSRRQYNHQVRDSKNALSNRSGLTREENNNTYQLIDTDDSDDSCEYVPKYNFRNQNTKLTQSSEHSPHNIGKRQMIVTNKGCDSRSSANNQTRPILNNKDETEFNLSFSGCGFLGIYHVGVATAFSEYAPQLSAHKISGSSAGALVATAHICGNPQLAYAITDFLTVAIDARSRFLGPFHPSFDINSNVREALERGMPENIHEMATGRLHISLTRVHDGENVIVSEFDSKEDVIQALLCSCFIPFWTGLVAPKFKGVSYIDGGFSNNLLVLDDKTITVAPFAGEYDICPQDATCGLLQINISNTSMSVTPQNLYRVAHALLPSPPEVLSELCEQGFADGIKYLQRMNLISCNKCLEIRSSLLVSANGEDLEEAFMDEVSHTADDEEMSICNVASDPHEHHHIRLEQQEQKLIQINGRRDSVVSTTSQLCQQTTTKHTTSSTSSETTTTTKTTTRSCSTANDIGTRAGGRMRKTIYVEQEQSTFIVDNCDQCVEIRQRALVEPMPVMLTERIRHACDTVNKSLSNWIYSHRPIKYLSYMAAPYYLPVDISLSLIYRWCWRRLPNVKEELFGCVNGLMEFLISVISKMDAEKSTSALLMETAGSWEPSATEYEKELLKHQTNNSYNAANNNRTTANVINNNNNGCSNNNHHHNCSSHHNNKNPSDYAVKITNEGLSVCKLKNSKSSTQLHSLDDTFDSIVDETSNQEARVFAYYFRDSKNRLQVTEIFDRERCNSVVDTNSIQSSPTQ